MEPIIATIKFNDSGAKVANLIECLLLLVERSLFKTFDAPSRPTPEELKQLETKARQELTQQLFGAAVRRNQFIFRGTSVYRNN